MAPAPPSKEPKRRGRKPGSPNKTTRDIRVAFSNLLSHAAPKLEKWLDAVADDDPAKALDLVARIGEYCTPKLARSEVTGAGGEALIPQHSDRELARRIAFILNCGIRDQTVSAKDHH